MTNPLYLRPGLEHARGKAIEEAGEFLAAMGKTMRHGWFSYDPTVQMNRRVTNEAWVRAEMADLRAALDALEAEMASPSALADDTVGRR